MVRTVRSRKSSTVVLVGGAFCHPTIPIFQIVGKHEEGTTFSFCKAPKSQTLGSCQWVFHTLQKVKKEN